MATGGSGVLASLVGVAKALEDSGTKVSVYSVCSGSALFGFPLGTGMPPEEVAELTASVRPGDYIDIAWREIATLVPALARGWCGIIRGGKLEAFYRSHFGDLTMAQLPAPEYAPVWNVEHNRLDCLGPRAYPDMPVAHAIRMAVSMPLFIQPAVLDGLSWRDGGIVEIFLVRPVLDIEPAVDTVIAVNAFLAGSWSPSVTTRASRLAGPGGIVCAVTCSRVPPLLLGSVLAGHAPGGQVHRLLVAAGAVDVAPQRPVQVGEVGLTQAPGSGDRVLAQHCHVIHAPHNAAVCGPRHDQLLPGQRAKRGGRQALAGEFAGDQAGHEAVSVAEICGAHVGLEDGKQRARVGEQQAFAAAGPQ